MAQLYIISSNKNAASIIKSIQHREEVKHSFVLLQPISKGQQGGAVNTTIAPEQITSNKMYSGVIYSLKFDTPWKEIDDQDKVMSCILLQNKLHLHQAFSTLLTSSPLKDYIRKHGMG
eukprot:15364450-Ditylum_brightwellii.AAC.1